METSATIHQRLVINGKFHGLGSKVSLIQEEGFVVFHMFCVCVWGGVVCVCMCAVETMGEEVLLKPK